VPTPANAFSEVDKIGAVALQADRSLRIAGVSREVWNFSVSGYQILYRWLRARNGEALSGESGVELLRGALDIVVRIQELLALTERADDVLEQALTSTLKRSDLGLPPKDFAEAATDENEDPTA
jgi:hypothetical protein